MHVIESVRNIAEGSGPAPTSSQNVNASGRYQGIERAEGWWIDAASAGGRKAVAGVDPKLLEDAVLAWSKCDKKWAAVGGLPQNAGIVIGRVDKDSGRVRIDPESLAREYRAYSACVRDDRAATERYRKRISRQRRAVVTDLTK